MSRPWLDDGDTDARRTDEATWQDMTNAEHALTAAYTITPYDWDAIRSARLSLSVARRRRSVWTQADAAHHTTTHWNKP